MIEQKSVDKLAAHYDERVAQHDGITGICANVRSERGKETRDIHAETATMLRALLSERDALQAQVEGLTQPRVSLGFQCDGVLSVDIGDGSIDIYPDGRVAWLFGDESGVENIKFTPIREVLSAAHPSQGPVAWQSTTDAAAALARREDEVWNDAIEEAVGAYPNGILAIVALKRSAKE